MPKKTKPIEKINETEQGTGIDQEDSSQYRGDITEKDDDDEVVLVTPIRVTPNYGTNEFTGVETHYKEGEQPTPSHWEVDAEPDAHPSADDDSRDGLGGISANIRCCDKIPAVKDRNITTEDTYEKAFFPDITDWDNKSIGYTGVLTDHPPLDPPDPSLVEYRCRYEVQPVGCENKYEYVNPCDCPKVYIWEYAVDTTFGYAESDPYAALDAVNHNTGAAGADQIADGITEVKYYNRNDLVVGENTQRTLHEPKSHPSADIAGTNAIPDNVIGSAFNGVAPLGQGGLYTKGAPSSRPNQASADPKPGWDGGDEGEYAIPAVGGGDPQVGYYSLRAENLTVGCGYVVGVTYEIVHSSQDGGTLSGAIPPSSVCTFGGHLYSFVATDSVNYLYGQEDGKNHDAGNLPDEPTDEDGNDVLPHTIKCVTPHSAFLQIPYATANATTGCGGATRNDGYDWETHDLQDPPQLYMNTDDPANPFAQSRFVYRETNFGGASSTYTREHEYVVYISGIYIQMAGVPLGRGEVLPHYEKCGGVVTHIQRPVGGDCGTGTHVSNDKSDNQPPSGAHAGATSGNADCQFGLQGEPPLKVGDSA